MLQHKVVFWLAKACSSKEETLPFYSFKPSDFKLNSIPLLIKASLLDTIDAASKVTIYNLLPLKLLQSSIRSTIYANQMASTGSSGSHQCVHWLFKIPWAKCAKLSRLGLSRQSFLQSSKFQKCSTSLTGDSPTFHHPCGFSPSSSSQFIFWMNKFAPPKGIRAKVMYILTFPYSMVQGFRGSGILCLKIPVLLGICKQRGPRILRMDSQGDCKALEFLKICRASEVS